MGQTAQHISKVNRDELLGHLECGFFGRMAGILPVLDWGAGCQRSDAQNRC